MVLGFYLLTLPPAKCIWPVLLDSAPKCARRTYEIQGVDGQRINNETAGLPHGLGGAGTYREIIKEKRRVSPANTTTRARNDEY